jgi:hypothetical protein
LKALARPSPLHLNRIGEFSADTGAARLFGFTGLNVFGAGDSLSFSALIWKRIR